MCTERENSHQFFSPSQYCAWVRVTLLHQRILSTSRLTCTSIRLTKNTRRNSTNPTRNKVSKETPPLGSFFFFFGKLRLLSCHRTWAPISYANNLQQLSIKRDTVTLPSQLTSLTCGTNSIFISMQVVSTLTHQALPFFISCDRSPRTAAYSETK